VKMGARQSLRTICLIWLMMEFILNPPGGVKMRAGETHLSFVTRRDAHRFRMERLYFSICDDWLQHASKRHTHSMNGFSK